MSLPTLSRAEVEKHNNAKSCYVTLGRRIFDVTHFIEDHPGGGDLILEYAGTDVTRILKDEISHVHTDAAYDILEDSLVGFLKAEIPANGKAPSGTMNGTTVLPNGSNKAVYEATGLSCAEDLSKDTDFDTDYKRHKFLDLNKPLLMQVWRGNFSKEFYLDQVHRPRHYKGGDSAPLFGNFLEPLSKTSWYIVPMVWLPWVAYGLYKASQGLSSSTVVAGYFMVGLALWTFIEYGLHRGLFHLDDYLPDNRVALTMHFLMHGIHHYLPMDRYRLVMPPTLFIVLATPFWFLAHAIFFYSWHAAVAVYCGGIFGYICYDLTHYFLHHKNLPSYYRELKKYHLAHHFADYQNGYGVTSRFWDRVFGTELEMPQSKVLKTS